MTGAVAPGTAGVRAGVAGADRFLDVFVGILLLNMPVAASLAAGVVSAGILTAVTGLLLGLYLGATATAAVNTVGAADLLGAVGSYVGLEMLGLLLAALAGFIPVATALAEDRATHPGILRRYASGVAPAGVLLAIAMSLILAGALVEAAVITGDT